MNKYSNKMIELSRLGEGLTEAESVDAVVRITMGAVFSIADADLAVFFLKEEGRLTLKQTAAKVGIPERWRNCSPVTGQCICGLADLEGEAAIDRADFDNRGFALEQCPNANIVSFWAVPLKCGRERLGVLGVGFCSPKEDTSCLGFLKLAAVFVAIALKKCLLSDRAAAYALELENRLHKIRETEAQKQCLVLQLQRAQKMEAVGTLAGGIAHDFNNILTPILMGAEILALSLPPQSPSGRIVKRIVDAGTRAKDLVQQILLFSRSADVERRPLRIGPIVKEIFKLSRAAIPSSIEMNLSNNADDDLVLANPTQLQQVLMNLITNAAHSMREKGGTLTIRIDLSLVSEKQPEATTGQIPPGRYLILEVEDTGHGIDPKIINKIFDPFFTTKPRGEGTGLGLSMVHGIVTAMGGTVEVRSTPGVGSVFTVLLPSLQETQSEQACEVNMIPIGRDERILLVDDEVMVAESYRDLLETIGYRVDIKSDPIDALQVFKTAADSYDLVITDMTMPKMTGLDLAKRLKEIKSDLPVIICTGFSEKLSETAALEAGLDGFVMKPVILKELGERIRTLLDGQRREAKT